MGDNRARRAIAARVDLRWVTAVHPGALVDPSATIGPGTVVFAGAVVQADAVVGEHAIVNTGAVVEHDCVVGDFAHVAPGVVLAGGVRVGEGTLLGVGTSVIPGVRVGSWSTVGAGSVVVRDLPDDVVAFGVPPGRGRDRSGAVTGPPGGTHDMGRIYLSPPHMGEDELGLVVDAFRSNWIAPLGPHVDAFEREFADLVGVGHAVALSSGTAAIHLPCACSGVGPGDEVLCPTLTFVASANPVVYLGAQAGLHRLRGDNWNIDPGLLEDELADARRAGATAQGRRSSCTSTASAPIRPILAACERYGVPVVEDAAEALGRDLPGPDDRGRSATFGSSRSTATRSSPPPAAGCWSPTTAD